MKGTEVSYPGICMEGLRNTTMSLSWDSRSPDWDMFLWPQRYEPGSLTSRILRSVCILCRSTIPLTHRPSPAGQNFIVSVSHELHACCWEIQCCFLYCSVQLSDTPQLQGQLRVSLCVATVSALLAGRQAGRHSGSRRIRMYARSVCMCSLCSHIELNLSFLLSVPLKCTWCDVLNSERWAPWWLVFGTCPVHISDPIPTILTEVCVVFLSHSRQMLP
jgi:hypothetical protein